MVNFDFLIAIDLQVTTLQEAAASEDGYQEVIEFPWVVIDVASKNVIESKVLYVKPACCSELGASCKKLTGFDDATLSSGCTLQECVQQFNEYLYKEFTSQNKDFCFVTDGDSSLKRWLRSDAKRKKVKLAAHYAKYIDVCAEFRQKYAKWAGADSCPAMADRLGIHLEPTVNGGLRMCVALAAVVVKLLEDEAPLAKTTTIPDEYDPLSDPLYAKGGAKSEEPLRARYLDSESATASNLVKCKGMPYSAQESDVQDFFAGCHIAEGGIWIVQNQFGRPSGEAYVSFQTTADALRATRRSRDLMNSRYVEVFASTMAEIDAAKASIADGTITGGAGPADNTTNELSASAHSGNTEDDLNYGGIVRMRGLPYTATYEDIERFFVGLAIKADGITICQNREGRNSGEAFVEFQSEESAFAAVKLDRTSMGARYVEIYKVTKVDLANYLKSKLQVFGGVLGMGAAAVAMAASNSEYFIKVRGLPFTAGELEVTAFFAKAAVVPVSISLLYNARNQPNGECYVELSSADDLSRALTLHRNCIGHRYVELFRTTRLEAMQTLAMPQPVAALGSAAYGVGAGVQADAAVYAAQLYAAGYGGVAGGYGSLAHGAAGAGAYAALGIPGVAGLPAVAMGPVPTSGLVRIRGLPYRTTQLDIAEFFRGFSFHPELIRIVLGADGRPNGEAHVTFASAHEAQRAILAKNKQFLGNRYVEILPA